MTAMVAVEPVTLGALSGCYRPAWATLTSRTICR